MTATLFQIGSELAALMALLDESNGEVTPENEAALNEWFAEVGGNLAAKADGYAGLICELEMRAAAAGAQRDQWAMKAQANINAAKRLKDRMKLFMEVTGQAKLQTATGRVFAIQKNGGKVPLELAASIDPNSVPRQYQVVKTTIDTEAVREALEAGVELDFATLGQRGTSLRLR